MLAKRAGGQEKVVAKGYFSGDRPFGLAYAEGYDPEVVEQRYLQSPELAEDVRDFNVGDIVSIDSAILTPSAALPPR